MSLETSLDAAERAVREADLDGALRLLQDHVRSRPSDANPRIFLFQLLSVLGQWDRALTQLNVAAELDAKALAMAQMYREALQCEVLRADVFAGKKAPMILGEPEEWLALLIESLLTGGDSSAAAAERARSLRERAFEAAPTTAGAIDGAPFEWIADGDMRLGPVCEAVINGRYYWVPFARVARIDIEAPADLRDVVWMPAHFAFANGGEAVAVIPTRYPGSEASTDLPRPRPADSNDGRGRAPGDGRADDPPRRSRPRCDRRSDRWRDRQGGAACLSSHRRSGCSRRSSTGSPTRSRIARRSRASGG
jgi:type VI secretion system protein ImpE